MSGKKVCFVIMGFGEKTDFQTQRVLNLDKTYKLIKKAVEESGHVCIRADEEMHSGVIDKPMYERLLGADLVIADLSTSNANALYELGIRHALRPFTTIVIAEEEFKFPFDLNHVVIRTYQHLGGGIDYDEAQRLVDELKTAITALIDAEQVDSPVYTLLQDLHPPSLKAALAAMADVGTPAERSADSGGADVVTEATGADMRIHVLMDLFQKERAEENWTQARGLLARLKELLPRDPYVQQQFALATYKSKQPDELRALLAAHQILEGLNPSTTNDSETLGLWGAVHKRLDEVRDESADLDTAIWAYERGFYLRQDYYNGINLAFLLDLRAGRQAIPEEAIADQVLAQRLRKRILALVAQALQTLPRLESGAPDDKQVYWLKATRLEALVGLGHPAAAEEQAAVLASAPESWMADTTKEQIAKLEAAITRGRRGAQR